MCGVQFHAAHWLDFLQESWSCIIPRTSYLNLFSSAYATHLPCAFEHTVRDSENEPDPAARRSHYVTKQDTYSYGNLRSILCDPLTTSTSTLPLYPVVQTFGRGWPSAALLSTFIAPLSVSLFEQPQIAMLPSEVQHLPATGATTILLYLQLRYPRRILRFRAKSDEKIWIWKNAIVASTLWIVVPRYPLKSAWRTQQCDGIDRGLEITHLAYVLVFSSTPSSTHA